MTEHKKTTVGQSFVNLLASISEDKEKLLDLACAVIRKSHSHRSLKDRNLPDDETAVKMRASVARFNALAGKDVSTDSMLVLIADTYRQKKFGSPEKFKEDFKKKHPQEYDSSSMSQLFAKQRSMSALTA